MKKIVLVLCFILLVCSGCNNKPEIKEITSVNNSDAKFDVEYKEWDSGDTVHIVHYYELNNAYMNDGRIAFLGYDIFDNQTISLKSIECINDKYITSTIFEGDLPERTANDVICLKYDPKINKAYLHTFPMKYEDNLTVYDIENDSKKEFLIIDLIGEYEEITTYSFQEKDNILYWIYSKSKKNSNEKKMYLTTLNLNKDKAGKEKELNIKESEYLNSDEKYVYVQKDDCIVLFDRYTFKECKSIRVLDGKMKFPSVSRYNDNLYLIGDDFKLYKYDLVKDELTMLLELDSKYNEYNSLTALSDEYFCAVAEEIEAESGIYCSSVYIKQK